MYEHETSEETERTFESTWTWVEEFYRSHYNPTRRHGWPFHLYRVAVYLRARYSKQLRAHLSVYRLSLSRSREWGLRPDQDCLRVDYRGGNLIWLYAHNLEVTRLQTAVSSDAEFHMPLEGQALIDRLLQQPIN